MSFRQRRWIFILVLAWMGGVFVARRECLPYDVKSTDVGTFLFQAQTFAAGQLSRKSPEPREFFQQWQAVVRDRSYAYYPPLHALILAIPIRMGLEPWLVSWVLGGGTLLFFYFWACRITTPLAAFLGTFSLALSPFFAAHSVSALSHSSCLFLTVLFLWSVTRREEEGAGAVRPGWIWPVFLGMVLALIFANRSLNAAALMLGWLPWLLLEQIKGRKRWLRTLVEFSFGGLIVIILLVLYYHAISGRWTLELFTDYWPRNRWGFGHALGRGEPGHYFQTYADHGWMGWIKNMSYALSGLVHWWTGNGWFSLFLVLLIASFLAQRFCLASHPGIFRLQLPPSSFPVLSGVEGPVLSLSNGFLLPFLLWPLIHVILYAFYYTPSTPVTGPRYAYEIMPVLALATGWGISKSANLPFGKGCMILALSLMVFFGIKSQRDFFAENARDIPLRRQLEQTVLQGARPPALVLIRSFWIGHPFPIFLNPPDMKAPILFACDRGEEDPKLMEKYPNRNGFILSATPFSRDKADLQLVPIYDGITRKWLMDPGSLKSPFYIGSRFTPPLELRGETARRLFHPGPQEIPAQ